MEPFSTDKRFIFIKTNECYLYFEKYISDDGFNTFLWIANNVNNISYDSKYNNRYCIDQTIALQK